MGKKWCMGMALFLLLLCSVGTLAASAESLHKDSGSLAVALAEETPPTGISFSPLGQQVAHMETITLAIQITDAIDLYAAQVRVHFDPTILAVVDADNDKEGVQIAPGNFPVAPGFWTSRADNKAGDIYYAASLLRPAPAANGSGTLATITFKAIGVGVSQASITSVMMFQADLTPIQPVIGENAEITVPTPGYPVFADTINSASQPQATANDRLRYTVAATNRGAEGTIAISDYLPQTRLASLITSTLTSTLGTPTWEPTGNDGYGLIHWDGQLAADQTITITFEMAIGRAWATTPISNTVVFQNFVTPDVVMTNVTTINPPNTFLPLLLRLYATGP